MSTSQEIREVYSRDINEKTLLVWRKQGPAPFYAGNFAFHIENLFGAKGGDGTLVDDWKRPETRDDGDDDA